MKYFLKLFLTTIVFIILLSSTKQDLPVHCLSNKIEGDWIIHMGDNHSDKDLSCGHKIPDQNLDHYDVQVEKALKIKHQIIINLERPNKVYSIINKSEEIGKWTMVYDEGFEFTIHNQVFFAFNRYEKTGKFSPSNTDTEDTPGYKSICDKTFIGWYHDSKTNENWGCFWAEKLNKNSLNTLNFNDIDYNNIFKFQKIPLKSNKHQEENSQNHLSSLKNNFMKKQTTFQSKSDDIFSLMNDLNINKPIQDDERNIQTINNKRKESLNKSDYDSDKGGNSEISYVDFIKSLGWDNGSGTNFNNIPHLDIFFLNNMSDDSNSQGNFLELDLKTKSFTPDYDYINKVNDPKNGYMWKAKVHDEFIGKSYKEMRHLLGNTNFMKNSPSMEEKNSSETDFLELDVDVYNKEQTSAKNTVSNHYERLPESFDWRNVDGANYDSPVRKQGECGSCYAIAVVSVLEARIRIQSNNRLKPILSSSSIISCCKYNQGCAGGYPYLVGKFGKEFGFVEENCQPYSESDDKCYNYCFHQKTWFVKEYGYIGGYYGGCDEEGMMREIYENGPIVVALNATPELYYYSSGIFHSDVKKTEGKSEKNVRPWEYTNHAVVCMGWGEEVVNDNTVKFWILKNSWGDTWGDKGYFRINRGSDMASIEAQGSFMSPNMD